MWIMFQNNLLKQFQKVVICNRFFKVIIWFIFLRNFILFLTGICMVLFYLTNNNNNY